MDRIKIDFSKKASSYDEYNHIQKEVAERLLNRLKFFKINPKNILDLGCGTGYCGENLQKLFPKAQIINLDFAINMCKIAKTKTSKKSGVVCANLNDLPIKSNSIDLIVSNFTFQWCESLQKVFCNIHRIIKPESYFLFSTVGLTSLQELRESWLAVDSYPRVKDFLNIQQIGDLLIKSGWQEPILDIDRIINYYPSVKNLLKEFKCLGVTNKEQKRLKGLTGKEKFTKFVENYQKKQNDNGIPLSWEIVYGVAKSQNAVNFLKVKNLN